MPQQKNEWVDFKTVMQYAEECWGRDWENQTWEQERFNLLFQLVPSTLPTDGIESGLLATPNTMDMLTPKGEKGMANERKNRPGRSKWNNLRDQLYHGISMLPTVRTVAARDSVHDRGKCNLGEVLGSKTGLRLQPDFAGWMMGYPVGYLDLKDGEMPL